MNICTENAKKMYTEFLPILTIKSPLLADYESCGLHQE